MGLRALDAFSDENHVDAYEIEELFNYLQNDEAFDEERLVIMEVKFLSLLKKFGSARPRTLNHHLAERPDFFCEIIRMLYRLRKEVDEEPEEEPEIDEKNQRIAECACSLLMDWDHPPGRMPDGSFDGKRLHQWAEDFKTKCLETGHWEIVSYHRGEVLFYAHRDKNGL